MLHRITTLGKARSNHRDKRASRLQLYGSLAPSRSNALLPRVSTIDCARFARNQTALRMACLETARLFKSGVNRALQWKVQLMCANPSVLSLKLDGTDFML